MSLVSCATLELFITSGLASLGSMDQVNRLACDALNSWTELTLEELNI
jgi:hypothetical protein